jgi:hypothetical protein
MRDLTPPLRAFLHAVSARTRQVVGRREGVGMREVARGVVNHGEVRRGSHGVSGLCAECANWLATDFAQVSYVGRGRVPLAKCTALVQISRVTHLTRLTLAAATQRSSNLLVELAG